MAMDFFEHQDIARRKTGRLVWLFVLAVAFIVALTYLVVSAFVVGIQLKDPEVTEFTWGMLWDPTLLGGVGLGVLAVVTFGSLYKLASLRGGGRVVAESLGGRLLDGASSDPVERKILNVVQEMAIASGSPVPPVYMMDNEKGINAFAAGFSLSDAVIGVTRGCVENLTRDELQGVIAHEFSHILNGDMRLNIRLMGVLHGILVIGMLGLVIFRMSLFTGGHSRRRGKDSNPIPLIALGLALLVIGYVGVFFGNMIKAALSRQREFLADASAVQFTRNPAGIAGALHRIATMSEGSRSSKSCASNLSHPQADEASHMFFGEGVQHWFGGAMATHPPLAMRIARIDPSFDGKLADVPKSKSKSKSKAKTKSKLSRQSQLGISGLAAGAGAMGGGVEQIGMISQLHLAYAASLVEAMPKPVVEASHEVFGARALVYALLLDNDAKVRQAQLHQLQQHADEQVYRDTLRLEPMVQMLDPAAPLALLDMAMAPLRELSASQYVAFKTNLIHLIEADQRVSLFEWTLQRILLHHLEPVFHQRQTPRARVRSLSSVTGAISVVLSTLAYVGQKKAGNAEAAFTQAMTALGQVRGVTLLPTEACGLGAVGDALDQLVGLLPPLKKRVVHACAAAVSADGEVTVQEAELFRALVDSLDCPVPPLLPGQPLR